MTPDHDQAVQSDTDGAIRRLRAMVKFHREMGSAGVLKATVDDAESVLSALTAETEARKAAEARATKAEGALREIQRRIEVGDMRPDEMHLIATGTLAGEGGEHGA